MNQESHDSFVCALLIGDYHDSRLLIHEVFRKVGWHLYEARSRKQALECLDRRMVQVVIANGSDRHWPWKKVLSDLRRMARPPQLVVTSRTADDSLWSEVLNWGGFDVLPEPFERDEVERVVASARRHFDPQPAYAARAQAAAAS